MSRTTFRGQSSLSSHPPQKNTSHFVENVVIAVKARHVSKHGARWSSTVSAKGAIKVGSLSSDPVEREIQRIQEEGHSTFT